MADRMWRVALPATLVGAVLGGGVWMLASQGGAEAAARKAAPVAATKYDRVTDSGNVFYKVPAGYVAVKQKGGVIMVPRADIAAGEINGYLLLAEDFALDAETQAKFKASGRKTAAQALAINAGNLADDPNARFTEAQLSNNNPAADGYEVYLLVSKSEDKDAGKTRYTQYAIAFVGDRVAIAMRTAYGSTERLEALGEAFFALTTSMEFRNNGAPPPTRLAAALPTDLAAITPKEESLSSTRESENAGNGASSGPGVVCRNEPRLIQRQSPVAASQGRFVMESFYGAKQVCRKNGKVVDVR